MNFLRQNLDNSLILPYDILRDIYQYSDRSYDLRNQIEKKDYDLNEIMFKRMKNHILEKLDNGLNFYTIINAKEGTYNQINRNNIDDSSLRRIIMNDGYKDCFLWKHRRHTHICGLEPNFPMWYDAMMIKDLKVAYPQASYGGFTRKELYNLWVKL